jgi:hypothetical protein
MELGRQTDVPEVKSYLDKRAVRPCRFCGARSVGVRYFASDVFPLIYADVGDNGVLLALIVRRHPACVPHSRNPTKIGDAVGIRIDGIKRGSLAGRTGKELVEKPVRSCCVNVTTRDRNWLNGEIGNWFYLGPNGTLKAKRMNST